MKHLFFLMTIVQIFSFTARAGIRKWVDIDAPAPNSLKKYEKGIKDSDLESFKKDVLQAENKAVPLLVQVMKDQHFSIKARWISTFLLTRIMQDKATPFITKFSTHPEWAMRLAALKSLLILKEKNSMVYEKALRDSSMLVRVQALENVRHLRMAELSPQIWNMLYHEENYQGDKQNKGGRERASILSSVIRALGELNYQTAKPYMLKMIKSDKYSDLFLALDFSLGKITGKPSPSGSVQSKRRYWKQIT
ncbi:MAG: hypothetical protein KBD63_00540 [Bacteriovoracaceae bacterium]|nr:hypothetical protein [Bacteriovoracaceae bacterium]